MQQSRFLTRISLTVVTAAMVCTATGANATTALLGDPGSHLYATIAQDADGKYALTNVFSNRHPHPNTSTVDLYDLTPTLNMDPKNCGGYSWGKPIPKDPCLPEPFRVIKTDIGETVIINTVMLGFGLFFGTTMKKSVFDEAAFKQALAETLPDATRSELINAYELVDATTTQMGQLQNDAQTRLNELAKKATVTVTVADQSGFYNNEVNFASDVTVAATLPPSPNLLTTVPEDLMRAAKAAPAQLAAYKFMLENQEKVYKVNAAENRHARYTYTISTPSAVIGKDGAPVVPTKVTISSAYFGVVYPSLTAKNKDLRVAFNGKDLEVANLTDSFVRFSVVSVYHGDKIKTVTRPSDSDWVVPPNGVSKFPLLESYTAEIDDLATYNHVTAAEAKRRKVHFGLALNYRVGDLSKEMTLYEAKNFNLFELLLGAN